MWPKQEVVPLGKHSAPKRKSRSPFALVAFVPIGLVAAAATAEAGHQLTENPNKQVAESTSPTADSSPAPASVTTGQVPKIN